MAQYNLQNQNQGQVQGQTSAGSSGHNNARGGYGHQHHHHHQQQQQQHYHHQHHHSHHHHKGGAGMQNGGGNNNIINTNTNNSISSNTNPSPRTYDWKAEHHHQQHHQSPRKAGSFLVALSSSSASSASSSASASPRGQGQQGLKERRSTGGPPPFTKRSSVKQSPPKNSKLHCASRTGDLETVKELVEQGVDVLACNNKGTTPIHLSAGHGRHETLRYQLGRARQENRLRQALSAHTGKDHQTPLHYAVRNNHIECIRVLLEFGSFPTLEMFSMTKREDVKDVLREWFRRHGGADLSSIPQAPAPTPQATSSSSSMGPRALPFAAVVAGHTALPSPSQHNSNALSNIDAFPPLPSPTSASSSASSTPGRRSRSNTQEENCFASTVLQHTPRGGGGPQTPNHHSHNYHNNHYSPSPSPSSSSSFPVSAPMAVPKDSAQQATDRGSFSRGSFQSPSSSAASSFSTSPSFSVESNLLMYSPESVFSVDMMLLSPSIEEIEASTSPCATCWTWRMVVPPDALQELLPESPSDRGMARRPHHEEEEEDLHYHLRDDSNHFLNHPERDGEDEEHLPWHTLSTQQGFFDHLGPFPALV